MDPIAGSLAAAMVLVLHKQTAALVAANAPVYGFSLIQAVAIFHFVMWIAQVGENIFHFVMWIAQVGENLSK